jgi:hypothetical protein
LSSCWIKFFEFAAKFIFLFSASTGLSLESDRTIFFSSNEQTSARVGSRLDNEKLPWSGWYGLVNCREAVRASGAKT